MLHRSPCLKLKPVTKGKKEPFLMVNVEPYGGGLWHTWFDRDLSLAGRVLLRAPDGSLKHRLVRHLAFDASVAEAVRTSTLASRVARASGTCALHAVQSAGGLYPGPGVIAGLRQRDRSSAHAMGTECLSWACKRSLSALRRRARR